MDTNTTLQAHREILTPGEVAEWLGVSAQKLADWRYRNIGPVFIRFGRMIRYEYAAVEAFIAAGRVQTVAA